MAHLKGPALVDRLRSRTPDMLEDLNTLVDIDSPSTDLEALRVCAEVLTAIGEKHIGRPEALEMDDRIHLRWRRGEPRVLVLGHYDTVWPVGTVARWGFSVSGGRASGPGIFDMKAGIVQGFYALAELDGMDGVEFLLTADEEIGGRSSRPLIEESAGRADGVIVLEPSADGALKIARKGGSLYRVTVKGRAAHAGLEPEKGINAVVEVAHQIIALTELADPESGTTVTTSMVMGGSATNTVPAAAVVSVDVRAASRKEQDRIDAAIRTLTPTLPGAEIEVGGGLNRPPLPRSASAQLFGRAQRIAADLGIGPLVGAEVGGGSDGNFTAALGTPTLDGMGAVGAGAHAEGEWIEVSSMCERAALVASLVEGLTRGD